MSAAVVSGVLDSACHFRTRRAAGREEIVHVKRIIAMTGAAAAALCVATTPGWAAGHTPSAAGLATAGSQGHAVAKSKTGSYIVVMKADPLVRSVKQKDLNSSASKQRKAAIRKTHDAVLQGAGVAATRKTTDYSNALNGFAVRTDLAGAQRIAKDPAVSVVLPDEIRQATSLPDAAGAKPMPGVNGLNTFLGLTGKGEAYAKGVTGEGVLVGVIDSGIWPEHPSFADDGTLPAAPTFDTSERSACDFGNSAWNPADAPFTCNNKLVGAREFLDTYRANTRLEPYEFDSARDNEGHGTHTASTAAGDAGVHASIFGVDKGVVSGIAPRAQVIAYKALGDGGGYTSDLSAAIDQAVADGVDVINYSIGGGAQTVSADTISFLFAADAGVFTAVSAGNSGPADKTIGGPADVPWVTGVGATTYPTFYKGQVKLMGGRTYLGSSVTRSSPNAEIIDAAKAGLSGAVTPDLCIAGTLDPAKVTGKIVLCGRGGNGRVDKSFEVQRAGGVGMVLYNQVDVDNYFTDNFFVPTVMVDNTPGVAIRDFVNGRKHPRGQLVAGGLGTSPFRTPTVAYFSSRGENPTSGDIIKPDLSAPGVQVMAGNTPAPSPGTQPAGELFQAIAGTSMAGPVVAGSYALLKQAHPDWSAAAAKSALMTTANKNVRDYDRVTQASPFAMGAGLAVVGRPADKGSAFQPGLVYDAGFNDYLGFLCAEGPEAFNDPAATCATLAGAGIPTTAANLNYASIGIEALPGSQTVTRTVTNVSSRTIRVHADTTAPAGYSVAVSPRWMQVAPGESKSFGVTITNTGAATGQWGFGSVIWRGDGYTLRSSIAVKGVAIAAPTAVTGTGTTGTATVPVQFGEAGAYTATAHGLVAAVDNNGTVSQDPDKTYPSPDDTPQTVVQVPFNVSGVNLARWSLVLPGNDDLDLYLLGPSGTVVATSTNGGTNEQVTLDKPADGTYTMVVHGWAVAAPNTSFDLRSWLVPNTSGGSLQVTSGTPVTAVAGATNPVGLSWTGLTTGTDYLGSVTHAIDGTDVASTVVSVTG